MFQLICSSSMMNSFQKRSGPNFVCFALAGQVRQLSSAGDIKMRWLSTKRKKKKSEFSFNIYKQKEKNIIENQCYWCAHRGSGGSFGKGWSVTKVRAAQGSRHSMAPTTALAASGQTQGVHTGLDWKPSIQIYLFLLKQNPVKQYVTLCLYKLTAICQTIKIPNYKRWVVFSKYKWEI